MENQMPTELIRKDNTSIEEVNEIIDYEAKYKKLHKKYKKLKKEMAMLEQAYDILSETCDKYEEMMHDYEKQVDDLLDDHKQVNYHCDDDDEPEEEIDEDDNKEDPDNGYYTSGYNFNAGRVTVNIDPFKGRYRLGIKRKDK